MNGSSISPFFLFVADGPLDVERIDEREKEREREHDFGWLFGRGGKLSAERARRS
jgi:hypothetical protein